MAYWNLESIRSDGKKIHFKVEEDGENGILEIVEMPNPITIDEYGRILSTYSDMIKQMEKLKIIKFEGELIS